MKSSALPRAARTVRRAVAAAFFAGLASASSACHSERLLEPDPAERGAALHTAAPGAPGAPATVVRFLPAGDGDVAPLVKSARAAAEAGHRSLLVYVGASWCEPCQKFHQAALHGELDRDLPPMTLLEFDADKDVPRLRAAGYGSTYIPMFALPGPDGRSSGRFIEGGIKGEGAAKEIAPRLKKLLGS
jgi:hypothetical protein